MCPIVHHAHVEDDCNPFNVPGVLLGIRSIDAAVRSYSKACA
jgi:hypothetical protein